MKSSSAADSRPANPRLQALSASRRSAETKLKESLERYEMFISQITDGVYRFEVDPPMSLSLSIEDQIEYLYDHLILAECNPSFLAMYGFTEKKDVIGKKQRDIFPGIDNPKHRAARRLFIESGYRTVNVLTEEFDHEGNALFISNNVIGIIDHNRLLRMWGTQADITDRIKAEKRQEAMLAQLRESEEKYRTLVEAVNEPIFIAQDGVFVFLNRKASELLRFPVEELLGKPFIDFVWPEDREIVLSNYHKRIAGNPDLDTGDFRIIGAGGSAAWVFMSVTTMPWKGKPATLNLWTDITERKAAAVATQKSLKEKEALLSEVYHRVKNNLQVISSLMNLQIAKTSNDECRQILHENKNRIIAMSQVHNNLYHSNDFSSINLASYIRDLTTPLLAAHLLINDRIGLETVLDKDLSLNMATAVPCGLIVNELFTNALKHAFPNRRKGRIRIELKRHTEGTFRLIVADDGIGVRPGIDVHNPETLGLQIVNLLVEQLDGSLALDGTSGTSFVVTFHELKYKNRL